MLFYFVLNVGLRLIFNLASLILRMEDWNYLFEIVGISAVFLHWKSSQLVSSSTLLPYSRSQVFFALNRQTRCIKSTSPLLHLLSETPSQRWRLFRQVLLQKLVRFFTAVTPTGIRLLSDGSCICFLKFIFVWFDSFCLNFVDISALRKSCFSSHNDYHSQSRHTWKKRETACKKNQNLDAELSWLNVEMA